MHNSDDGLVRPDTDDFVHGPALRPPWLTECVAAAREEDAPGLEQDTGTHPVVGIRNAHLLFKVVFWGVTQHKYVCHKCAIRLAVGTLVTLIFVLA